MTIRRNGKKTTVRPKICLLGVSTAFLKLPTGWVLKIHRAFPDCSKKKWV
jgi:hypothetical protein